MNKEPSPAQASNVAADFAIPNASDDLGSLLEERESLSGPQSLVSESAPRTRARALYEDEILVKFQMSQGECRERDVTFDGVTRTEEICQTLLQFDHPYDAFTHAQLKQIHETDAIAAYILGMKTFHDPAWQQYFEYETSVNYLHDAAVLSGKAQPYLDMLRSRQLDRNDLPPTDFSRRESYVWYEAGIRAGVIRPSDRPTWMDSIDLHVPLATIRDWNNDASRYAENLVNQRAHATGDTF